MPGKPTSLTITTVEAEDAFLEEYSVEVTVDLSGNVEKVYISKNAIFAAIGEDDDLMTAIENNQKVEIKFIIKDSDLSEEEKNLIEENLKGKEVIAFCIDISIELYVDDEYVKNITELETPISFSIGIPENLLEGNKEFAILRTHKNDSGEFEVTRDDYSNSDLQNITITSDKFSNFTFAYKKDEKSETKQAPATVTTDNGNPGGGSGESSPVITTISTIQKLYGPQTGDKIWICLFVLTVAIVNLMSLSVIEQKKLITF